MKPEQKHYQKQFEIIYLFNHLSIYLFYLILFIFIFFVFFYKKDFFFFFFPISLLSSSFSLSPRQPLLPFLFSLPVGQIRPASRPTQALRRSFARGRANLGWKPHLAARSARAHRATWVVGASSPGLAAAVSSSFELSHGPEHLHLA